MDAAQVAVFLSVMVGLYVVYSSLKLMLKILFLLLLIALIIIPLAVLSTIVISSYS